MSDTENPEEIELNDGVGEEVEVHEEYVGSDAGSGHSGGGESFCSSIGCSFIGVILILAATYGHYANEKKAVEKSELYTHVEKTAIVLNSENKADFKGKLVHLTALINIENKQLQDPKFKQAKAKCVRMSRSVEMYQLCETKTSKTKTVDGKKKTYYTYSYAMEWKSSFCDPEKFEKKIDKETKKQRTNPDFNLKTWSESSKVNVKSGKSKISLSEVFTDQISWENSDATIASIQVKHDEKTPAAGKDKKGDYKISWTCIGRDQDEVSVLGKVSTAGNQLEPYSTELRILWTKFETDKVKVLNKGEVSLASMVESMRDSAKMWLWILRAILFIACIAGSIMFWGPLSYLLDQIPCCGDFLAGIIDFFAGVLGFLWSLFVVIIVWILVRPILILVFGIVLVLSIGGIIAYKKMNPKGTKGKLADDE